MSIEKLIGDLIVALDRNTAALQAVGHPAPAAAETAAVIEKAQTAAKKSTTAPASSAPAPAAEQPEPAVETASPAAAPAASEITRQDVTDAVLALGKAGKRDALVKLLGEYGVPKASALADDQLAGFHAAAQKLLA
jgi:pyruvate/2-oxoglutarate dehydrogenase complex dihydrolipoamide acyltransferase (E2) component